jgi:hypothetical protein
LRRCETSQRRDEQERDLIFMVAAGLD